MTSTRLSVAARAALSPYDPNHIPPHQAILGLEINIKTLQDQINTSKQKQKWHDSWERFTLVLLTTYTSVWVYLKLFNITDQPEMNAVVPTLGYALSVCQFTFAQKLCSSASQLSVRTD